jgi:hypothetical protein
MASLFWPGDLGGHFGTALQQLGQLCTSMVPIALPNLPTQCTPVPQALKDNAGALNDPVKAETFLPGGPVDAEYKFTPPIPGVTMKSHAEGTTVDSLAGFASFGAPGLGTLGSVTSHSVAKLDNATAVSQATSELFDVALAGGLVTIEPRGQHGQGDHRRSEGGGDRPHGDHRSAHRRCARIGGQ